MKSMWKILGLCGSSAVLLAACGGAPEAGTDPEYEAYLADLSSTADLSDSTKKEYSMEIVSSAENSSLNWKAQYSYIQDIKDGRGYTAGIIGFCSGTGDMLELVQNYTGKYPSNGLAKYLPALKKVNGTASHTGLDPNFKSAWAAEAKVVAFQSAQNKERDDVYFNPSLAKSKADGLHALGQFAYYDASVVHGYDGMLSVRSRAMKKSKTPAQGGDEKKYLSAFLDERVVEMKKEEAHSDVSRIETAQRVWLKAGNLNLNTPLSWKVYGDSYGIKYVGCDIDTWLWWCRHEISTLFGKLDFEAEFARRSNEAFDSIHSHWALLVLARLRHRRQLCYRG